ncbi:nose resistant to fluoxetine protein 6-like isoform X2 [Sipha flava]|nr:nose resistant to fluoxetine protein 6-like isoform X2 [Sipha flava]
MAESWTRHPNGFLSGNTFHMGFYDECIDIHHPVKGQYCLSEIKLIPSAENTISHNEVHNRNNIGSYYAWQNVLGWINYPDQIPRNVLNLGICIPASCSSSDLQKTLQNELDKVFLPEQINTVVKIDPILCTVKEDMYPYSIAFHITSAILVVLIFLCCVITIYQYTNISCRKDTPKKTNDIHSVLYSFSFIESGKDLLKYDKNNELNLINGIKLLTMMFILLGHRFMYLGGNPMTNVKIVENMYINGPDILLTCMNLVDPFFFMSGYLIYITITPVFQKSGPIWMKIVYPIIYRVVRMLPTYCMIMAITANIIPHLGDGPLWPQNTWKEAELCKNYWWTNVLFISNFFDSKYQCLLVSWYLSCDIQFFIIGVITVCVYTKNEKYGKYLIGILIGVSLFLPFVITYVRKIDGILKVDLPFLNNPRGSTVFNQTYREPYLRAIPFIFGLAMGFIGQKLKESKFKFSQITVYAGSILITLVCVCIQLLGAEFYKYDRLYSPIEHALYATLSHCTWTTIGAWITICHLTTGYGLLSKIFTNRLCVILGRLSYSVFLINLPLMQMSQSSQRQPTYLSAKTLLELSIFDSFKCYLMSLILYMVVEGPFGNLTKHLFGRRKKDISSNTIELPIEQVICIDISKENSSKL